MRTEKVSDLRQLKVSELVQFEDHRCFIHQTKRSKNPWKNYYSSISNAGTKTGITKLIYVLYRTKRATNGSSKATILGTLWLVVYARTCWLYGHGQQLPRLRQLSRPAISTRARCQVRCDVKYDVWCQSSGLKVHMFYIRFVDPVSKNPLKVTFLISTTRKKLMRIILAPCHLHLTTTRTGWAWEIKKRLWHCTKERAIAIMSPTSKKRSWPTVVPPPIFFDGVVWSFVSCFMTSPISIRSQRSPSPPPAI